MTTREFLNNIAEDIITEEMKNWCIERMDEVQKNKTKKLKNFAKPLDKFICLCYNICVR
jgi:hypothetical protein